MRRSRPPKLESPGGVTALDAGCGHDSPLRPFRPRIARLVGADIHAPGRAAVPHLDEFAAVDLCAPDGLPAGAFDVLLSNFTARALRRSAGALGQPAPSCSGRAGASSRRPSTGGIRSSPPTWPAQRPARAAPAPGQGRRPPTPIRWSAPATIRRPSGAARGRRLRRQSAADRRTTFARRGVGGGSPRCSADVGDALVADGPTGDRRSWLVGSAPAASEPAG